jgi:hypothetical protein
MKQGSLAMILMRFALKLRRLLPAIALLLASQFAFATTKYCVEDMPDRNYESYFSGLKPRYKRDNEVLPQDLSAFSVVSTLRYPGLWFTDKTRGTYLVAELDPDEPYNFWDTIGELDGDWIYVGNGPLYDHVLHVQKGPDQRWHADKVIRLQKSGFFEWVWRYVFDLDARAIKMNGLSKITYINDRVAYSRVLRKLFLLDWSKEFSNGRLIDSNLGYMKRYIGDVPELGVAIFFSDNYDLYYFDGIKSAKIDGGDSSEFFSGEPNVNPGHLMHLERINQTFFVSHKSIFGFAKTQTGYKLQKLQLPTSDKYLFFSVLLPTPTNDDVAIFTRDNIFLLSDMQGIFPRVVPNKQINTTGSNFLPGFIPSLGGILFSTGGSYLTDDKKEYFHLLKACEQ